MCQIFGLLRKNIELSQIFIFISVQNGLQLIYNIIVSMSYSKEIEVGMEITKIGDVLYVTIFCYNLPRKQFFFNQARR